MNPDSPAARPVVIIGAGISGLCVAHWLHRRGIPVRILERDAEPGGTMKTVTQDGWLVERGPNSALETTPLLRKLFDELGITGLRLYADDAASKRYIVRGGTLHPLPSGIGSFLTTPLWSAAGKLRLLGEPFAGRAQREESIAEFVTRRLGREFLDYAINPFVAGVYAGDPAKLSVRSAFPKLYNLEAAYGGLIVGAIRSARERRRRAEVAKDRARLFSFTDGMQMLPRAIAASLGNSIVYGADVTGIIPTRSGGAPEYVISFMKDGIASTMESPVVVLSAPASSAAAIIDDIDPATSGILRAIDYPPVAEVFLGFAKKQLGRSLDGFGFLVPEVERRSILGTIWSSALFPRRAPEGYAALTTFVGGSRQPALAGTDDPGLIRMVLDELHALMGITGEPVFHAVIRWKNAIPQYTLGYASVNGAIDRFEQNYRGTFICSNYRGGIAVGDCVMNADTTATRIAGYYESL